MTENSELKGCGYLLNRLFTSSLKTTLIDLMKGDDPELNKAVVDYLEDLTKEMSYYSTASRITSMPFHYISPNQSSEIIINKDTDH